MCKLDFWLYNWCCCYTPRFNGTVRLGLSATDRPKTAPTCQQWIIRVVFCRSGTEAEVFISRFTASGARGGQFGNSSLAGLPSGGLRSKADLFGVLVAVWLGLCSSGGWLFTTSECAFAFWFVSPSLLLKNRCLQRQCQVPGLWHFCFLMVQHLPHNRPHSHHEGKIAESPRKRQTSHYMAFVAYEKAFDLVETHSVAEAFMWWQTDMLKVIQCINYCDVPTKKAEKSRAKKAERGCDTMWQCTPT